MAMVVVMAMVYTVRLEQQKNDSNVWKRAEKTTHKKAINKHNQKQQCMDKGPARGLGFRVLGLKKKHGFQESQCYADRQTPEPLQGA